MCAALFTGIVSWSLSIWCCVMFG